MEPLALYIHWPFCAAKCPYCDFNSHVRPAVDRARFAAALRRELAYEAARAGQRQLVSIFFGGGTPSLMDPAHVAALIADARAAFAAADELEITLEANPTSVEAAKLRDFAAAGVNRLSLGVQALRADSLRFLGRNHDAADAIAAFEIARATFPRLSFDLIYARPGQSLPDWRAELREALALAADHLSLYQLTIEPSTGFAQRHARGEFALPEGDAAAALYEATAEEAARFGLNAYEVSNYASLGAESRHNLQYWRYGDYLGIGAGAHQRLTLDGALLATVRKRTPEAWADAVERDGHAIIEEVALDAIDRAREALLMGLRLAEGIDPERFAVRTGVALADALDADTLRRGLAEDYLDWPAGGRLRATSAGRLRLDALLAALVR